MEYPRELKREMVRTAGDLEEHWEGLAACAAALGFELLDPEGNVESRSGLGRYLEASGVRRFSAGEVVTPRFVGKARSVGYESFVPPWFCWPWVAVLLRLGDAMRDVNGEPVTLRNLWRPQSYNRLVASSSKRSDHPNACGGDFVFRTVGQRRKAEGLLRGIARHVPELDLSLGLGQRNLHVGVRSPKGAREWWYPGYGDRKVRL